jgi:hypothetical protein
VSLLALTRLLLRLAGLALTLLALPAVLWWLLEILREGASGNFAYVRNMLPYPLQALLHFQSDTILWLGRTALGLYLLLGNRRLARWLCRGLSPSGPTCPSCGYPTSGLSADRCPECGSPIRKGA